MQHGLLIFTGMGRLQGVPGYCRQCKAQVKRVGPHSYLEHQVKTHALQCPICKWAALPVDEGLIMRHVGTEHQWNNLPTDHLVARYGIEVEPYLTMKRCSQCVYRCVSEDTLEEHFRQYHQAEPAETYSSWYSWYPGQPWGSEGLDEEMVPWGTAVPSPPSEQAAVGAPAPPQPSREPDRKSGPESEAPTPQILAQVELLPRLNRAPPLGSTTGPLATSQGPTGDNPMTTPLADRADDRTVTHIPPADNPPPILDTGSTTISGSTANSAQGVPQPAEATPEERRTVPVREPVEEEARESARWAVTEDPGSEGRVNCFQVGGEPSRRATTEGSNAEETSVSSQSRQKTETVQDAAKPGEMEPSQRDTDDQEARTAHGGEENPGSQLNPEIRELLQPVSFPTMEVLQEAQGYELEFLTALAGIPLPPATSPAVCPIEVGGVDPSTMQESSPRRAKGPATLATMGSGDNSVPKVPSRAAKGPAKSTAKGPAKSTAKGPAKPTAKQSRGSPAKKVSGKHARTPSNSQAMGPGKKSHRRTGRPAKGAITPILERLGKENTPVAGMLGGTRYPPILPKLHQAPLSQAYLL